MAEPRFITSKDAQALYGVSKHSFPVMVKALGIKPLPWHSRKYDRMEIERALDERAGIINDVASEEKAMLEALKGGDNED